MTTTELENLVVRLTGDASGFINMLKNAEAEAKNFASKVTTTLAAVAEFAGFRNSMGAFVDFQDNLIRLETTVKANGLEAESTMEKYKEFANVIEETTRYSATATIGLLANAHAFGLVGEQAEKAVRMAIGLSQGRPGVNPGEALRALSMVMRSSEMAGEEGGSQRQFGMYYLARMLGLAGRGMGMGRGPGGAEQQQKMMEEINKQLKIAEEISKKLGESFGGQLARIKSYLQDIGVELGSIVSKWLEPFVKKLGESVKWFKELDPNIKRVITALFVLATVLTAGGPIMRFFLMLVRLSLSISPVTLAIIGAVIATAAWVKQVGGLSAAWDIVSSILQRAVQVMRTWISGHQRLVVALSLTTAMVVTLLIAYRALMTVLTLVQGVMTILHLKQIAMITATVLWRTVVLATNLVLGAAGLLAHLAAVAFHLTMQIAKLVLSTAAWLTYHAVILSVKATLLLFELVTYALTGSLTAITAIILGAYLGFLLYSAAVVIANVAVGAAVGLMAGLGLAATILGTALTTVAGILSAGFLAGWQAARTAVTGFLDTLLAVHGAGGILTDISDLFHSWAGYVLDAYHALTLNNDAIAKTKEQMGEVGESLKDVTTGMDLAWEMGKIGFQIMVREMQLLWPPLFDFIQEVAKSAWEVLKTGWYSFVDSIVPPFKLAFNTLIRYVQVAFAVMIRQIFTHIQAQQPTMEGILSGPIRAWNDFATKMIRTSVDMQNAAEKAITAGGYEGMDADLKKAAASAEDLNNKIKERSKLIANAAKQSGKDVEAALASDKELASLKEKYGTMKAFLDKAVKVQADAAKKADQNIDLSQPFKKAEKEIHKWEAALFGSAEAFTRWQEYLDKINDNALEKATEQAEKAASGTTGSEAQPSNVKGEGGGGGEGNKNPLGGNRVEALLGAVVARLNGTLDVKVVNGAKGKF